MNSILKPSSDCASFENCCHREREQFSTGLGVGTFIEIICTDVLLLSEVPGATSSVGPRGPTKEATMPLTGKTLSEWVKAKQTQSRPQPSAVAGQHRSAGTSMTAPTTAPALQPAWTPAQKPANVPERSVVAGEQRIAAMVKELSQQLVAVEHMTRAALARAEATQDYGQL